MPKFGGNTAYYADLSKEMHALGCDMRTAEVELLYRLMTNLTFTNGWTHGQIQKHLEELYGLKRSAYYTRLKWVRKRYALP